MKDQYNEQVVVKVEPQFMAEQSVKDEQRYVFSYRVQINNHADYAVKLLHRHWLITDGNGQMQEVRGEGVVGQQPVIEPGSSYQYESGSVLSTLVGSMQGHYEMVLFDKEKSETENNNADSFKVEIPVFTLAVPNVLN